jgi:hypothetical protein
VALLSSTTTRPRGWDASAHNAALVENLAALDSALA